ncbi:MAG: glutamate--cysteine ligase [Alphaproteobacteria bacterium]|nr:glutamate--cysteine ligase [Alphaproteobacteria bacterium]
MSGPGTASAEPITNYTQLVEYIADGGKSPADWRIGTEHEKFGFRLADHKPLDYEGANGIRAIFARLVSDYGWEPVLENGNPIALTQNGQSVTLEPGGQFELSGAPLKTVHETCAEVTRHLEQLRRIGRDLGIAFMGQGFAPDWKRSEMPMMPKGRYGIMRAYMPKRGKLGLDMMFRTCTVQVNLDFANESDMVKKFRVGLALQPIATALFANSPFTEGKPNGFLSLRSHIWTDTDPDRTGLAPFVFEPGMSFARYVDYALDTPMYFVYRDGHYVDASGQSFRDFLAGKLPALPGEIPTFRDWQDHLTTLFPEVRLKTYLEMRGADGGPWARICALPALWVGLLYDTVALDAAWDLAKTWTIADMMKMRREGPKRGLNAKIRNRTVGAVARDVLAIAEAGLRRRQAAGGLAAGDEVPFLDPLKAIVEAGKTPAEEMLIAYRGRWGGSVKPVYSEYAY